MEPLKYGTEFIGKQLWYREGPTKQYHSLPGICTEVCDGGFLISTEEGDKTIYFQDACNYDPNLSIFDFCKIVDG